MINPANATIWYVAAERLLHGAIDEAAFMAWLLRVHRVDAADVYAGVPVPVVADLYRTGWARHVLTGLLEHDQRTSWAAAYRQASLIVAAVTAG